MNYLEKDIEFGGQPLAKLLFVSAFGGFIAGFTGQGGSSIYNPALLSFTVHPKVASATGIYIVVWSTLASSIVDYLAGSLLFYYGVWIGFWCVVGTIIGLKLADNYTKKSGNNSFTIWIMIGIFVSSGILNPVFGGLSIDRAAKGGTPLWGFNSFC